MYVRLGNLLFALASLVILALAEFADAQVAELPIEREWGIKLAERVRTIKMADIDGDGIEEILVGTGSDSGYVYVIHGITHETEWKSPGLIGRDLSIGVGDSNGDSIKEIVVGTGLGASESGNVYIFDGLNHTLEWHKSGFDERVYSIAIGDFDMDDSTEILVGTFYHWHNFGERYVSWGEDGELYILDGSNYSQEIVYSTGVVKRVQIIDINEDGVNESAIGSHKGASLTSDDPIDYGLSEVKVSIRRGIVDLGSRYLFRYDGLPWYPPFPYFLEMTVGNCDSHYQ